VLYVSRYTKDQAAFCEEADRVYQSLTEYHQLFDIYNEYSDMNNLKTVNDKAGLEPVKVDRIVVDLLLDCREYYEATDGRVNVAMGSVLKIWHDVRSHNMEAPDRAVLPDTAQLEEASGHCGWDTVVIDEENSTVFITDPAQSLDVGAVAKGWAVQKVADTAEAGLLISLGGNVCATGPKNEAGDSWTIGIQNPDREGEYLHKVGLTHGSAVTSGDYQRCFMFDGKRYHHIIDPDTRMPAELWRSVTVLCADSGVADMLSTALFLMDRAQGMALLEMYNAEAMWLDGAGNCYYSAGFEARLKK
jgi:thiamine biosynthesis lipoprotein